MITAPPPIGRDELRGLQFLSAPRHVREPDEDQILERFADGEQLKRRHAVKV